MDDNVFPEFAVRKVELREPPRVLGTVTTLVHGRETWLGHNWIGYLFSDTTFVRGRWLNCGDLWCFVPDRGEDVERIEGQRVWAILDGYWGERAELVVDPKRQWRRARFKPRDAVEFSGPTGTWTRQASEAERSGGNVVKGGWDHEHCAICSTKIGNDGDTEGYVDGSDTWVCERCFGDYVAHKSLDFIPGA